MAVNTHTLTIPSSTSFLEEVREFVTSHATQAKFAEGVVEQMKMAVDEACTNVIEHSYEGNADQVIDITITTMPDKLVVVIRDKGLKFDRAAYQEPDLLQYAKSKKTGGFGVHIMRKLMDSVEYRNTGGFNECCMIKFKS